jgi:hypothetical protein
VAVRDALRARALDLDVPSRGALPRDRRCTSKKDDQHCPVNAKVG